MKKLLIPGVIALLALGVLNHRQGDELQNEQAHYCNKVRIFQDTNGERGWPDYNNNAKEVCRDNRAASSAR